MKVTWWFYNKLEMWANAQLDGRPAEYRWRTLFNAAKFNWRPLLEYRAVTLPRRETRWNLQRCLKLANRSQPQVRSSPYCEDMWGDIAVKQGFSPIVDTCLSCEDIARQSCTTNGDFFGPAIPASRAQHISDLHSQFALRPHHVSKYSRHTIFGRWD